jgi:TRAP-type C4-dicarboxylate transport system permease small subunit
MQRFVRILDALTHVLVVISGIAISLMALHIVADVAGRYLFRAPLPGTVEFVSRYYMVVLVFLPLALVQQRDGHFVAGLFTDNLPLRAKQRLIAVTQVAMAAVALLLAWRGVTAAEYATSTGEQVQAAEFVIMTWPGRWLVPLGLGLMALQALVKAARLFAGDPSDTRDQGGQAHA